MSKRPWTYEQHAAAHAYFRNLEEEKSKQIKELEKVMREVCDLINNSKAVSKWKIFNWLDKALKG